MDIFQLKCFISLAQTLSFTQSALLLHISQSAFSRHISALEKELGVYLFRRDQRWVELTAAGSTFLEEVEYMMTHYERGISRVSQGSTSSVGSLKIGILSDATHILAPLIINNFLKAYPNINITFKEFGHTSLMDSLNRGMVDAAFISSISPAQLTDVRWKEIQKCDNAVVMHPSHPLAGRESIEMKDLANERFVLVDPKESTVIYTMIMQLCLSNGFSPSPVVFAKQIPSVLFMVSCKQGITILPIENQRFFNHEVHYIPLKNTEYQVHRLIAWKEDNRNSSLPSFISEADKFLTRQSKKAAD